MKKLNLRLLRMIKHSKGQFIAVTAVIIIGLLLYTALKMAAINLSNTVNYYYEKNNFPDLYVEVVRIPSHAIEDLVGKYGITEAEGRIVEDVPLKVQGDDSKVNVRIISTPVNKDTHINSLFIRSGSLVTSNSKETVVIEQFANARKINIDDILEPQINGKVHSLKVTGVVASPEFVYLMENEQSLLPQPDKFGILYLEDRFARQVFGYGNDYNEILIKLNNPDEIDIVKSKLEEELDRYGLKRIIKGEDQLSNSMIREEINQLKKTSTTVPIIFLGVAAIILAVMISRIVKNDRMTIGVLKALGYNNIQIISHYSKLSLIMGLLGGSIGTTLGLLLSTYLTKMYLTFYNIPMLKTTIYFEYVASAILLSISFCIIAGLWGTRNVIKILPAESMRPESPKKGKRIILEKIPIIWNKISFSWKMVIRNIFRGKKKFITVTLGIALTFSITFLTVHLSSSFDAMFYNHYGKFLKMDYNINLSKPLGTNVLTDVKNIVDIDDIEGKIEYPFEISYGWKNKVVNIIGIDKDTVFYEFKDINNNIIKLPPSGIVLSSNLAKSLGVQIGDKVKIKNFIPEREDEHFTVKNIVKQNFGMNAYMEINEMSSTLMDRNMITGIFINSSADVKSALDDSKNINNIQSINDLLETFKEFVELSIASFSILLLFSGILGFAIVYNSTIMGITERRLEFSSLRVLGFTRREIYKMIVKENFIMAFIGIIIGLPIGRFMISIVEQSFSTDLYTFYTNISIKTHMYAALLTLIFVIIAQLSTYRKINKLDFMEALKSRIS